MKVPSKLNPMARIVEPNGTFTREGFNLISDLLTAVADLQALPSYADTDISDIGHVVNTKNKKAGVRVLDSVNHRVMVARGPLPADEWDVADGSASVTPA